MRDESEARPEVLGTLSSYPVSEVGERIGHFQLSFWVEQKPGQGEDAEPVLKVSPAGDQGLLSVFDGMGGAGSSLYTFNGISRTGAYVAARLASEVVEAFFSGAASEQTWANTKSAAEATSRSLQEKLLETFRSEVARLEAAPSRLGGKMMRRFPTTMACLSYRTDRFSPIVNYAVYWAGDSRAYLLSPNQGLQQITTDDLTSGGDALQNLLEDSAISNCVNADANFAINSAVGMVQLPIIFLVATDGCFSFLPTPAHFEHTVLDSLMQSSNSTEWCDSLKKRLHAIAGDDLSLALVAVGWSEFDEVKERFRNRRASVLETFVKPIDDLNVLIGELVDRHKRAITDRDTLRASLWNRYKEAYAASNRAPQAQHLETFTPPVPLTPGE